MLDVIDAIEGPKPLFECQEIRGKCAIFGDRPPSWSTDGVCGVHMVMLRAEQAMRAELGKTSVADLARNVGGKAPPDFAAEVHAWLSNRVGLRAEARRAGVEQAKMVRATASGDGTA